MKKFSDIIRSDLGIEYDSSDDEDFELCSHQDNDNDNDELFNVHLLSKIIHQKDTMEWIEMIVIVQIIQCL